MHGVAPNAEFAFQGAATFLLDTASEPYHPEAKGFRSESRPTGTRQQQQQGTTNIAGVLAPPVLRTPQDQRNRKGFPMSTSEMRTTHPRKEENK